MSKPGMIALAIVIVAGTIWIVGVRLPKTASQEQPAPPAPTEPVATLPSAPPTTTPPVAPPPADPTSQPKNGMHRITLETSKGIVQFETYDADAPKTVENFITLANKGFYDKLIFHRVIKGFMVQGGDPNGTGTGGPGYKFDDELNPETQSYKDGYKKGVVAMANAGPNTNGSQFFIMLADYPLPNSYTIFGRVVKGQDVVDQIGLTKTDGNDRPAEAVTITKATVETVQ